METQIPVSKSPHPLIWVAGIAVIIFSGVGIAAFLGWIPASMGGPSDSDRLTKLEQARPVAANPAVAKPHSAPVYVARNTQDSRPVSPPVAARAHCAECGVIESTREVEAKGEGTGLGAVGGAVAGGLIGSQIGGGNGKTAMAVVGAVGGAVAGNEVEKRVKSTKHYEITVRFEDGSSRVITEANAPNWRTGDRVRVVNGAIQSNA
jgi:outer membrane lipoprotein SlyB